MNEWKRKRIEEVLIQERCREAGLSVLPKTMTEEITSGVASGYLSRVICEFCGRDVSAMESLLQIDEESFKNLSDKTGIHPQGDGEWTGKCRKWSICPNCFSKIKKAFRKAQRAEQPKKWWEFWRR